MGVCLEHRLLARFVGSIDLNYLCHRWTVFSDCGLSATDGDRWLLLPLVVLSRVAPCQPLFCPVVFLIFVRGNNNARPRSLEVGHKEWRLLTTLLVDLGLQ